jgi:hypothetical protein
MVQYIYFVKCPNCEDEHFDFFDEAKEFALGCLSQKPVITQTEVNRNDFGECTDHCDLGTVWSWEDMMDKETDIVEPTTFSKDAIGEYDPDNDPEFQDDVDFEEAFRYDSLRDKEYDDALDSLDRPLPEYRYTLDPETGKYTSVLVNRDQFTADELKKLESCERKPIPEGMTIEELVEEMEENEDTVECTSCQDLFDKSTCRKELNLGWLCRRCADDLVARGEGPVFKEDNYWDFLDEDIDATKSLADLVKDSINHLVNDIGRDSSAEDFADDVITDIENNYDIKVPEDPEKYRDWASAVACEVSRQLNNPLGEDLDSEELHDLGNEYDGGYPAEGSKLAELEDTDEYSKRLTTCPECGEKSYDTETSFCISCGFN